MNRLDALKEAEALVERLTPETPTVTPRSLDRSTSRGMEPVEVLPSIGERISQILRVADYLVKESDA